MKSKLALVFGIVIALIVFSGAAHPPSSLDPLPDLYAAEASPDVVNFGAQPQDGPIILCVRLGAGGAIDRITVDLGDLSGAGYYDPVADCIRSASTETSMMRVYEIEGEEAYLIETGSRYKYNEYRTAISHRIVRGVAEPTNKWQVELPDAGHSICTFNLKVSAVNKFSHTSTTRISLEVVEDVTPPLVELEAGYSIDAPAVRPGDNVLISAMARDDRSGVYSVRLSDVKPADPFRERKSLAMSRRAGSDEWVVEYTVGSDAVPGTYTVRAVATDRAGNEATETLKICIKDRISSYYIRLDEGWNLISVPRPLVNPVADEVFAGAPVQEVKTVIESQWMEPGSIQPGRGYLVRAAEQTLVEVEFDEYNVSRIPLTMKLGTGWNLIGYASPVLEPSMPLTYYLGADLKGEWMVVYTESGAQARAKSTSPYIWATDSFPTENGEPFSEDPDNLPVVELGHGYWIYITGDGLLIP